jgi:hypothetical protein
MRLKSDLYPAEQGQVRKKILDILALDGDGCITLHELDNDAEKKRQIMELLPEIYKWFTVRDSLLVRYPEKSQRSYLSIVKLVLKPKYTITSGNFRLKVENETIRTQKFCFRKGVRSEYTK